VILVVLGFVGFGRFGWIGVVIALGLFWLRVGWLPPARYARWRWRLTDLALELRYGVLVRQYEAVPYFRIQQIDITQGPIDRMLGLATLIVTTASASGSATLPGIAADEAPPVRAELLARAANAVAEHPGDLQDAV
jgi:membrane protein YdbS with pleckstrin-like domain